MSQLQCSIVLRRSPPKKDAVQEGYTSGLQRLAGVYDPPQACDIPIDAEFYGDYDGRTS